MGGRGFGFVAVAGGVLGWVRAMMAATRARRTRSENKGITFEVNLRAEIGLTVFDLRIDGFAVRIFEEHLAATWILPILRMRFSKLQYNSVNSSSFRPTRVADRSELSRR